MPTDIQDYLFSSESAQLWEKAQDSFTFTENQDIRHLSGRYERYYMEEEQKRIVKDIVNINADGRVIVRSVTGIFKGLATYFMNATLSIQVCSLNDTEAFSSHILGYVGRFSYNELDCLHAVCTTIDSYNVPLARVEILVPSDTFGVLSEYISVDSQGFYKLNYKYPHLYKLLQKRSVMSAGRVQW